MSITTNNLDDVCKVGKHLLLAPRTLDLKRPSVTANNRDGVCQVDKHLLSATRTQNSEGPPERNLDPPLVVLPPMRLCELSRLALS